MTEDERRLAELRRLSSGFETIRFVGDPADALKTRTRPPRPAEEISKRPYSLKEIARVTFAVTGQRAAAEHLDLLRMALLLDYRAPVQEVLMELKEVYKQLPEGNVLRQQMEAMYGRLERELLPHEHATPPAP